MTFNSGEFLIFFPIVTLVYFLIPKKIRYIWLLAASYFFYMCWNVKYILLLITSTVVTWLCGWLVHKGRDGRQKKLAVGLCLAINIGILFYFKYFDFFLDSIGALFSKFGIQLAERSADILLPVGISFYIFQAIGYTIDVYRNRIEPEKNLFRYALFVSFFPQLVAGPIERSENLLRQMRELEKKKLWNWEAVTSGLVLMVWGLFVKMVIADRIAVLVDNVFDNYYMYGTVALAAAAIGFAIQIYADFMGYSTIAIGAARVMGFTLMENFETPYFSKSVSEFWRRWHISLSTWFRDYLYIPLGGNRCSRVRKYFNIMVTMAVSGMWHGANWTYLVWGVIHGIYQVVGDITGKFRKDIYTKIGAKTESISFRLAQALSTFALVDIAWIFFRSTGIKEAIYYCVRLVTKWDPWSLTNGHLYTLGLDRVQFHVLTAALLVLLLVEMIRYYKKLDITAFLDTQCIWFRWAVILCLGFTVLIYGCYGMQFDSVNFIYFQF